MVEEGAEEARGFGGSKHGGANCVWESGGSSECLGGGLRMVIEMLGRGGIVDVTWSKGMKMGGKGMLEVPIKMVLNKINIFSGLNTFNKFSALDNSDVINHHALYNDEPSGATLSNSHSDSFSHITANSVTMNAYSSYSSFVPKHVRLILHLSSLLIHMHFLRLILFHPQTATSLPLNHLHCLFQIYLLLFCLQPIMASLLFLPLLYLFLHHILYLQFMNLLHLSHLIHYSHSLTSTSLLS